MAARGADEARALVEYCNHTGGTTLSDLRRSHGSDRPHAVRHWCLGNEMDAPWQIGQKTADEYGRLARNTARLMRSVSPDVLLTACGSSNRDLHTRSGRSAPARVRPGGRPSSIPLPWRPVMRVARCCVRPLRVRAARDGCTAIFALNRHLNDEQELAVELRGMPGPFSIAEAIELHHADMKACNKAAAPQEVSPRPHLRVQVESSGLRARLKPGSWNVFVLASL